jgi:hypothetical protein
MSSREGGKRRPKEPIRNCPRSTERREKRASSAPRPESVLTVFDLPSPGAESVSKQGSRIR